MKIPAAIILASQLALVPLAQADVSVKLGVLNDRSGPVADSTGEGSVIAARMAVEDFQAEKKGIKVEIISGDHQNKPDVGATIARKWFDTEGVDVVLDVPISSVAFAVSGLAREKDKLFIASGSGSSELTGSKCSPNTMQFSYDTWSVANSTAKALVQRGGKTWYFLTADFAFGHALERDASEAVKRAGGTLLGASRAPLFTPDFSSFLLKAQASKADVIGLANGTVDTRSAVKQGREFGLQQAGQRMASLLIVINDVKALGLEAGQGLLLTEPFYWDLNARTREWSKRFASRNNGRMPSMLQAGVYSGVLHYLKAVHALGSKDTQRVIAKMKELPTDDAVFGQGRLRNDGRKIHDMYLFEVKKPSESKGEWDLYKVVATIPAEQAFLSLEEAGCAYANARKN
ncbi:ABC transporter substrate-binding protein [Hydrogenophaga borbori]